MTRKFPKAAIPLLSLFFFLLILPGVHAHCPLCTAAVGTAAVTAKYYGLGENSIGLFVGAFAVSTGLWAGRRFKKEYIAFQLPLIVLLSFLLTVIPLVTISTESIYVPVLLAGSAGSLFNKVYWIDKIVLGSIIGGLITLLAFRLHLRIKKTTGHVLIPFQGIVLTLALLIAAGFGLYVTVGA